MRTVEEKIMDYANEAIIIRYGKVKQDMIGQICIWGFKEANAWLPIEEMPDDFCGFGCLHLKVEDKYEEYPTCDMAVVEGNHVRYLTGNRIVDKIEMVKKKFTHFKYFSQI